MTDSAAPPTVPSVRAAGPSRTRQVGNFLVFQAAWFAAVLGAAHQLALWGTACVAAAIAWHLAISARPAVEARLVVLACLIGLAVESALLALGYVVYPAGAPGAALAPYWLVALWGLFAISLNVTLRWLKHRPLLAATFGALGGPGAFASGVRLGAARFVDTVPALLAIACAWALLMPLLMWLSNRFDGVVPADAGEPAHA